MQYTDNEVLSAIKNGKSADVLNYLYRSIQPKIRAWVIKNNGDEEEAQDIFQDAIIAFYKYVRMNQFKEENSIAGFIFSISKNLWINRVKQKNRFTDNMEIHTNKYIHESEFSEQIISDERAEKIQEILSQLGERCKELLTYSVFQNMSMEDICKKMGFNNSDTAKTKNYKCKQRLIKLVKDHKHFKKLLYS
jgi:RNA polymerase sigma factor (sigma-70 family)